MTAPRRLLQSANDVALFDDADHPPHRAARRRGAARARADGARGRRAHASRARGRAARAPRLDRRRARATTAATASCWRRALHRAGRRGRRHAGRPRGGPRACRPTRPGRWPRRARPAWRSATTCPAPTRASISASTRLLGVGQKRAPEGALADAIAVLNALRAPVLSVDAPTGLSTDTGAPARRRRRARHAHADAADRQARPVHRRRPRARAARSGSTTWASRPTADDAPAATLTGAHAVAAACCRAGATTPTRAASATSTWRAARPAWSARRCSRRTRPRSRARAACWCTRIRATPAACCRSTCAIPS